MLSVLRSAFAAASSTLDANFIVDDTDISQLIGVSIGEPHNQPLTIDADVEPTSDRGDGRNATDARLVGGFSYHVWGGIAQYTGLNFSRMFNVATWGSHQNLNNSVVGALVRGEADVSVNWLAHCCKRMDVIDLSDALYTRQFSIVFKQPDLAQDIFAKQFSWQLWLSMLAMLALLFVAMRIVQFRERPRLTLKDSLTWIFCIVSQQGHDSAASSASSRLVLLTGFAFGLLLFDGFSAGIVSTLSSARSIQSFRQLIDHTDIKIYGSFFPPFNMEIYDSQVEDVRRAASRMDQDRDGMKEFCQADPPTDECDVNILQSISSSDSPSAAAFVAPELYIYDPTSFEFLSNDRARSCRMSHFRVPMGEQPVMYGVRRGLSPKVKATINKGILRLKEAGLMQRMYRKNIYGPPSNCDDFEQNAYKAVSIKYVFGAYGALASGWVLAIVIAVLEILHVRPDDKHRLNNNNAVKHIY